jgi:polyhydroxyalkanoate synthesis regulator phasin
MTTSRNEELISADEFQGASASATFKRDSTNMGWEALMLKETLKVFFLGAAAVEISKEKLDEYVQRLLAKVAITGGSDTERIEILKEKVKAAITDTSAEILQRSELLEARFHDQMRRQVSEFSLETLGDSSEINELRAEIASLRAELVQLRSSKISV